MSKKEYIPKPGSLAEKVIGYFRNNPGHMLFIDEIKEQFSVQGNVVLQLEEAVTNGWLTRAPHDLDMFGAGYMLKGSAPAKSPLTKAFDEVFAQGKGKAKGRGNSRLKDLDIDALQIDKDVPIPTVFVRKKHESKWAPLFAKLATKGDSVALPDAYRSTIDSYIRKLTKAHPKQLATYKTGRDDNGATRVWRIA